MLVDNLSNYSSAILCAKYLELWFKSQINDIERGCAYIVDIFAL